jgi:hypothetical protein
MRSGRGSCAVLCYASGGAGCIRIIQGRKSKTPSRTDKIRETTRMNEGSLYIYTFHWHSVSVGHQHELRICCKLIDGINQRTN